MFIGIDIGLRNLGFAALNQDRELFEFGCFKTCAGTTDVYRISYLLKELEKLFSKYIIKSIAMERVFLGINPNSCLRLAELKGAVIALCIIKDIEIFEYHPTEVKHGILSKKNVSKADINETIRAMYPTFKKKNTNISDAIAIGFYHVKKCQLIQAQKST